MTWTYKNMILNTRKNSPSL